MPFYTRHGKRMLPLTDTQFQTAMNYGDFKKPRHRAFLALLYHTGVRVSEALRARREQFTLREDAIYFDVLRRLKRGIHTPPLRIDLAFPHADTIRHAVQETTPGQRVFPYCRMTGYLIVRRALDSYPHHLRLSKFTNLLMRYPIPKVRSWSGLTLSALNFYAGIVDIEEMGTAKTETSKSGQKG